MHLKKLLVVACSAWILSLSTPAISANVGGVAPPPNTIELGQLANRAGGMTGGVSSPIINQAPMDIRPQIVPSTQSMVQSQVNEYSQMQLTPEQMQRIKEVQLSNDRITSTPYLSIPEPVVRSLAVNLSPGETPPIIRVAKNVLTSIVFTDTDGNPWTIDKVILNRAMFNDSAGVPTASSSIMQNITPQGDTTTTTTTATPNATQVNTQTSPNTSVSANQQNQSQTQSNSTPVSRTTSSTATKEIATNILTIEPNDAVSYGNVSIMLKGKPLPVIFLLTAGQPAVDIRVDAHIPGKNPDAVYKPGTRITVNTPTPDIDNNALAFLDGTVPDSATTLMASDSAVQAWEYNNSLYLKSRLDVLYPNFMSRASSPDGMNIYRFDVPSAHQSVTMLQRNGQPVTVTFEPSPYSR